MITNSENYSDKGDSPFFRQRKITCVVPDDGTERTLIESLREEKGILTCSSKPCRGIGILRQSLAKKGKLPESELVRLVDIIVPEADAHELFDYIYETADIGKLGGGVMWIGLALKATLYTLPDDIPEETAHLKQPAD